MVSKEKVVEVLNQYLPESDPAVINRMAAELALEIELKGLALIREGVKRERNKVFKGYRLFAS